MKPLTVEQLLHKLIRVKDVHKPLRFNKGPYWPDGFRSWRGSYNQLALGYTLDNRQTVRHWLRELIGLLNTQIAGYKSGQVPVNPDMPVWVANWGQCDAWSASDQLHLYTGIVDIREGHKYVNIITDWCDSDEQHD